jgi:hypothetical protein
MLALTLGLAFAGWNCISKTDSLVKRHRDRFEKTASGRFYPFAIFVEKSWYPIFLRGCGVAIWLFGTALIYLTWFRKPAH